MRWIMLGGIGSMLVLLAAQGAMPQDKGPPKKLPPFLMELLKKSPEELIKQFDKNSDLFLAKDELPPFLAKNFEKFDKNSDGLLNREETGQMLQATRQFLAAQLPGGGGGPLDFDALDKNADGRLTKEELKGTTWLTRLAEIDTNRDGRIDRREVESFLKRAAEKK